MVCMSVRTIESPVAGLLTDEAGHLVFERVDDGVAAFGFALDGAAYGGGGLATLGSGVRRDVEFGLFGAVLHEHLGGFELVVRLVVGVLAVYSALEETDDVASAIGLLADDVSEGL